MQQFEKLLAKVPEIKVNHDSYMPTGLRGLYHKKEIHLNSNNSYQQNVAVLAEEIGHYLTSTGDITDYTNTENMKQELKARRKAVKLVLPLEKLIECYENGVWGDVYEMCGHLEIDESFFEYAVNDYRQRFGEYVKYDGYKIKFSPLEIEKL